jgi:N-methylhydantoinase A
LPAACFLWSENIIHKQGGQVWYLTLEFLKKLNQIKVISIKMNSENNKKSALIGIDTGGTFTDFIFEKNGKWNVFKILSTPLDPSAAVLSGIDHLCYGQPVRVIHGSTVATNTILEKKGARIALVTNQGFEDIIEIGRQNRLRLYDLAYQKDSPLVPRNMRFGIKCRINASGNVLTEPTDHDLSHLVEELKQAKAESVAVSLLFSFVNTTHELKIAHAIRSLHLPISLSHQILSEFREYERTSTVVINAYVAPKMKGYLSHISKRLGRRNFRIMQSNGGSILSGTAMKESVRTILSGPAGGVVGARKISEAAGYQKVITFDMGGTSTDVALINRKLPLTTDSFIGGYPVKVPMIDIHTVGAGGGSIARIDRGGSLRVGPESAGADPGPVCYGHSQLITVTDANLFLGRIVPEYFLGGHLTLHTEPLRAHFCKMSRDAGLDENGIELAEGILAVANSAMERAIRIISVERGMDPREFSLFVFGGAGGLHGVFLARMLNIPRVIIPENPGILSAMGMLMADIIKDYSRTVMIHPTIGEDIRLLDNYFVPMVNRATKALAEEQVSAAQMVMEKYLDMRYKGQSYEIMVPFSMKCLQKFHDLHQKQYGYCNRNKPLEIVNVRLRAIGSNTKTILKKQKKSSELPSDKAFLDSREVIFDGTPLNATIVSRNYLNCGNKIDGPAIIVEYSSTTVGPPGSSAVVDPYRNLIISV